MGADGAIANLLLDEDRDPFEMADLYPRTTGLPVTVWVSPRGGARHDARLKVSPMAGERMDIDGAAVVAVGPRPTLLHGELDEDVARQVFAWVAQNDVALVAYWNGELDTVELGSRLARFERGLGVADAVSFCAGEAAGL